MPVRIGAGTMFGSNVRDATVLGKEHHIYAIDLIGEPGLSARRGILEWIVQAKTPPTRAKRIAETARLAQDNVRANQWRPK